MVLNMDVASTLETKAMSAAVNLHHQRQLSYKKTSGTIDVHEKFAASTFLLSLWAQGLVKIITLIVKANN